nr:hypothetical protein CFP56_28039 [Quercus suber]
MGVVLVLAACLSHGGLAHKCYLDLGCVPLPRLLPHGGYHGLRSMHVGMPWPWKRVHRGCLCLGYLPIGGLFSQIRVFSKRRFFPQRRLFRQASMPWPRQHARRSRPDLYCLSIGAVLILAACLYHGRFPIGVIMALETCIWACHGLGSMPTKATMTLAAFPLDGYFPK